MKKVRADTPVVTQRELDTFQEGQTYKLRLCVVAIYLRRIKYFLFTSSINLGLV